MTRDENDVSKGAVYISFTHIGSLEIVLTAVLVAGKSGVAVQSQPDSQTAGQSDGLFGTQIFWSG